MAKSMYNHTLFCVTMKKQVAMWSYIILLEQIVLNPNRVMTALKY